MNKRTLGQYYENAACQYLEKKGFRIVDKNFRCRQGEIDVIGWHGEYLVFAEVKYRSSRKAGYAAEAVTRAKQRVISRVADYYRYRYGIGNDCAIRYDVVAIEGKKGEENISWYQNAFEHIY